MSRAVDWDSPVDVLSIGFKDGKMRGSIYDLGDEPFSHIVHHLPRFNMLVRDPRDGCVWRVIGTAESISIEGKSWESPSLMRQGDKSKPSLTDKSVTPLDSEFAVAVVPGSRTSLRWRQKALRKKTRSFSSGVSKSV